MDNCCVNVMVYLQYYLSDRDEGADPEDQSDDEISTTLSMASDAESLVSVAAATLTYDEGPDAQGADGRLISGFTINPIIIRDGEVIFGFQIIHLDLFRAHSGCIFLQGLQNLIKSLAFRTSELNCLDLFRTFA